MPRGDRQHLLLGQPAKGDAVFQANHDTSSDFRRDFSSPARRLANTNGGFTEWRRPPVRLRNGGQLFLISILRSAFTAAISVLAMTFSLAGLGRGPPSPIPAHSLLPARMAPAAAL
jgi:hypothetical protein